MNWIQLKTVIWLRLRLTRNQFVRAGKLNTVIAVVGGIIVLGVALGAAVTGVFSGAFVIPDASPMVTMLIWDGVVCAFLFFWALGVFMELQRSETIDLARLLHLPVSLEGIFVINFIASHFTFGIIFFLPAILGICAGLVWAKGALMLLLFPLALSFIFMVSAWTYCLRGWLISLMVNPRRRRSVMMVLTISLVLMGQLPNIYFTVFFPKHMKSIQQKAEATFGTGHAEAKWEGMVPPALVMAQNYVPVFWLPRGAVGLVKGDVWPTVFGTMGALVLGVAGLARAYRSTIRFYRGVDSSGPVKVVAAPVKMLQVARANFMEREVPFVGEEIASLALAFFRSLTRAPEVKIMLFTNFVVLLVFVPMMLLRFSKNGGETAQLFFATAAVGFTFFGMLPQLFNVFGYDREGFRSLVLSPAARRSILLAKNISIAPIILGMGAGMLAVLTLMAHLTVVAVAASLLKLGALFVLMCVAGNLVSIWVPYRVSQGSLKPTKLPFKAVLMIMLGQMLYPVVMIPIFIAPTLGFLSAKMGWWPGALVDGIVSAALLGTSVLVYWLTLDGLAEMLEQREKEILLRVTREDE